VLIVDDDDDLCDLLTLILQKNGPVHVEYTLKDAESHDYWAGIYIMKCLFLGLSKDII